jgi:hypothetical protein
MRTCDRVRASTLAAVLTCAAQDSETQTRQAVVEAAQGEKVKALRTEPRADFIAVLVRRRANSQARAHLGNSRVSRCSPDMLESRTR